MGQTNTNVPDHALREHWFASIAGPYARLPVPVLILCLGSLINRTGSFVMVFLTIYTSERLGFGIPFATKCLGAFGAGSIVASMVGGSLADRIGRKPVMIGSLFGGAIILVLLSFASNRWSFLLLTFSLALVLDMFRPAASAMVGDLVEPFQRPHAFALMYISFNLGFALAAPIGGLLAAYSYLWLFWADAITTACFGVIVAVMLAETLPRNAPTHSPPKDEDALRKTSIAHVTKRMLADQRFVLFSLATLLTSIVFVQAFTTLPIHMKQIGFREDEIGRLFAINGVLIVLCQLPVTHWLSRFDRIAMIVMGEVLLAVGFGATGLAVTALHFAITIIVWTIGEVVQASFQQSFVADLAPAELRGRYMGVFSLCHGIGITVGAPLGGEILSRYGHGPLWFGCGAIACVSVAIYGALMLLPNDSELATAK